MDKSILVTGGAGYIGSHTCLSLLQRNYKVTIIDNLRNSSIKAVEAIEKISNKKVSFIKEDLRNKNSINKIFEENKFDGVIHFAGSKAVGESVNNPLYYYENNVTATISLLQIMQEHNVTNFIFSSSATVYGKPEIIPIPETAKTDPTNPYGETKLAIEKICNDLSSSNKDWKITVLRYFNPIGADPSGEIGEDPKGVPNNLVPYVMQVAVGRLKKVEVYGNDWDTIDGTGVRDYIHVVDLAEGHCIALENLNSGCSIYNLGRGSGYSVLEIIKTAEKIINKSIPYQITQRREGDIAKSIADPSKAIEGLGWKAELDINSMIESAWNWQSKNPNGFE